MERFECDKCGACCQGHLIVEADELDLLREPRLIEASRCDAGKSVEEVRARLQSDYGQVMIIAIGPEHPCPFLTGDNLCSIYPTRPNDCVGMEAGDEQCQHARASAGLPPLQPVPTKTT